MRKSAGQLTEFDKAWIRRARRKGMKNAEIGAYFGQDANWASEVCVTILKMPKRHKLGPRVVLTDETKAVFVQMWNEGRPCREIGARFGKDGDDWASWTAHKLGLPARNKYLTNKQVEELTRRAEAGEDRREIARSMGISAAAVWRLTPHVQKRQHPRKRVDAGRADRMIRQGMTYEQVAAVFGVTNAAVWRAVDRYRAPLRKAAA